MNYIERLKAENAALIRERDALLAGMAEFRSYVLTDRKFTHTPRVIAGLGGIVLELVPDPAERRDWIATGDVARHIEAISSAAIMAREG